MVGGYVEESFAGLAVRLTDRQSMDVRDRERVLQVIAETRPSVVLHLAAETDVDRCEKEPDHAYRSNVTGTLNIALACQQQDVELVYVSTLGVFDGHSPRPYTEDDQPSPVNVYASTKLEGERLVREHLRRCYIVRTGWMFGGKERDKKFVGKIAALCSNGAGKPLKVVSDKIGNPVYALDLLHMIRQLLSTQRYGLYHIVNEGSCSRYELALEIARLLGRNTEIVPVSSDAFPLPAPRPDSEAGFNTRLAQIGLGPMRHWKLALKDYLDRWSGQP